MYYTDLDLVRARLNTAELPETVKQAYLQVLTHLNAISTLLTPEDAQDDGASEAGFDELQRLFAQHQRRRLDLEQEFPQLALLSRPAGWEDN